VAVRAATPERWRFLNPRCFQKARVGKSPQKKTVTPPKLNIELENKFLEKGKSFLETIIFR